MPLRHLLLACFALTLTTAAHAAWPMPPEWQTDSQELITARCTSLMLQAAVKMSTMVPAMDVQAQAALAMHLAWKHEAAALKIPNTLISSEGLKAAKQPKDLAFRQARYCAEEAKVLHSRLPAQLQKSNIAQTTMLYPGFKLRMVQQQYNQASPRSREQ